MDRKVILNIFKFRSIDNLPITGYFCYPKACGKVPCVVIVSAGIHGSFFKKGSQEFDEFHLKWCWYLIKNNVAVLYIDKRGSYGYGNSFQCFNEIGDREIDDIGIGSSQLSYYDIIDANKIYGYGVSRMCLAFILAELKYKIFGGLFLLSGFYDIKEQLLKMDEKYVEELLGKYSFQSFPYEERSPINLVTKIGMDFSLLLVCGKDDDIVFPSQSVRFYQKLKETKHKKVRLIQLSDSQHSKENTDPDKAFGKKILKLLLDFVNQ